MSHFIANQIKFSQDFKYFKVKGGDNNMVPRSDDWTEDIPVHSLLYEISSGNIELTPNNPTFRVISNFAQEYQTKFEDRYGELDWRSTNPKSIFHFYTNPHLLSNSDKEFFADLNYNFAKAIKDKLYSPEVNNTLSEYVKIRLQKAFPSIAVEFLTDNQMQSRFGKVPNSPLEVVDYELPDSKSVGQEESFLEPQTKRNKAINKIDDFGEKIGGARKDFYKSYTATLRKYDGLSDRDLLVLSKSEIIPEPEYSKVLSINPDFPKFILAYTKLLYAGLGNKPRVSKYSNWKALGWIDKARKYSDFLNNLFSNADNVEWLTEFSNQLRNSVFQNLSVQDQVLLQFLLSTEFWKQNKVDLNYFSKYFRIFKEKNSEKDLFVVRDYQNQNTYHAESISDIVEILINNNLSFIYPTSKNQKDASKRLKKKKQINFAVFTYRSSGEALIGVKYKGEIIKIKEGLTVEEARLLIKNETALEDFQKIYEERIAPVSERGGNNEERIGMEINEGDISPQTYQETFGFRGVEFGNYLTNTDRQKMLNKSYEAFMDMATVLDIPPKAISLNGTLAMAFGARGKGGKNPAMAHYEPLMKVINLTKLNGAGALAHEWWHSLDNYLGIRSKDKGFSTDKSYNTSNPFVQGKEEMYKLLLDFKERIDKETNIYTRSREADKFSGKKLPYYSIPEEMSARTFEYYIKLKLEQSGIRNDFLVNFYPEEIQTDISIEKYPYPLESEKKYIENYFDEVFDLLEYKIENNNVLLFHADKDRILGHYDNNKIYLNKDYLTNNTAIHEFSHLWIDSLKILNPDLYGKGMELIESYGQEYIERIKTNEFYKNLSDEQILQEALATAIGDRGEKAINEGKGLFGMFLTKMKNFIQTTFFYDKRENLEQLSLDDFLNGSVYDLLQGSDLKISKKENKKEETKTLDPNEIIDYSTNQQVTEFKTYCNNYISLKPEGEEKLNGFFNVVKFYCRLNDYNSQEYQNNIQIVTNYGRSLNSFTDEAIYKMLPEKGSYSLKSNIRNMDNYLNENTKDEWKQIIDKDFRSLISYGSLFKSEFELAIGFLSHQSKDLLNWSNLSETTNHNITQVSEVLQEVLLNNMEHFNSFYKVYNDIQKVDYSIIAKDFVDFLIQDGNSNALNNYVNYFTNIEDADKGKFILKVYEHIHDQPKVENHSEFYRVAVGLLVNGLDLVQVNQPSTDEYLSLSDKWASELSIRTDLSLDMTTDQIDAKQAYYYRLYELSNDEEILDEMYQELDLFRNYEHIPKSFQKVFESLGNLEESKGLDYLDCEIYTKIFEAHGYTFDYSLDASPYYLRPIGLENQVKLLEEIRQLEANKLNNINNQNPKVMENNQEPNQEDIQPKKKKAYINAEPGSELKNFEINLLLMKESKGYVVNFLKDHFSLDIVKAIQKSEFKFLYKDDPMLVEMNNQIKDKENFKPLLFYKEKQLGTIEYKNKLDNNFTFSSLPEDNKITFNHINYAIRNLSQDAMMSVLQNLITEEKPYNAISSTFEIAYNSVEDLLDFPTKDYQLLTEFKEAKKYFLNYTNKQPERIEKFMNEIQEKIELSKDNQQKDEQGMSR